MSTSPSALPSLLGGVGLALSAHSLLALNGSVFGISGFLHRAARGSREAAVGVLALVLGGFAIGKLDGPGPSFVNGSLRTIALSGLLVGIGTKVRCSPARQIQMPLTRMSSAQLGNGCTSGSVTAS